MKYLKQFLLMAALLLTVMLKLGAQNQTQMQHSEFSPEESQALNAVLEMTKAFHQGDLEGVMGSYEPEALVVFEPEKPIRDEGVLREMFTHTFAIDPRFVYSGHEVFVNGNLAIHIAPWTMTGTAPDGSAVQQSGLSVAVLRQQADGSWKMVFDNPHAQFLLQK